MCCKVFKYENKRGISLYLNGSDSSKNNPELMLDLYVTWYNNEFAPFENPPLPPILFSDYKFICSFCPIDFYDESSSLISKMNRY